MVTQNIVVCESLESIKCTCAFILFRYGKNSSIPVLGQGKCKMEHVDYSVVDETTNGVQPTYATSQ